MTSYVPRFESLVRSAGSVAGRAPGGSLAAPEPPACIGQNTNPESAASLDGSALSSLRQRPSQLWIRIPLRLRLSAPGFRAPCTHRRWLSAGFLASLPDPSAPTPHPLPRRLI